MSNMWHWGNIQPIMECGVTVVLVCNHLRVNIWRWETVPNMAASTWWRPSGNQTEIRHSFRDRWTGASVTVISSTPQDGTGKIWSSQAIRQHWAIRNQPRTQLRFYVINVVFTSIKLKTMVWRLCWGSFLGYVSSVRVEWAFYNKPCDLFFFFTVRRCYEIWAERKRKKGKIFNTRHDAIRIL